MLPSTPCATLWRLPRRRPAAARGGRARTPPPPCGRSDGRVRPARRKPAGREARGKSAAPKLEPRIEEYFAADPARESTALEISTALGADDRGVRLSLGRMAKKNKATKLEGGRYRAYSA